MDFCDKELLEKLESWNDRGSFIQYCGIRLTGVDEGGVWGEMPLLPHHFNPNEGVHGGALYALADTMGGYAALAWGVTHLGLPISQLSCTTVNGTLHYLRPAGGSLLTCRAEYRKMGRTVAVVDTSIRDDRDREVCSGTFTFLFVDRERFSRGTHKG